MTAQGLLRSHVTRIAVVTCLTLANIPEACTVQGSDRFEAGPDI